MTWNSIIQDDRRRLQNLIDHIKAKIPTAAPQQRQRPNVPVTPARTRQIRAQTLGSAEVQRFMQKAEELKPSVVSYNAQPSKPKPRSTGFPQRGPILDAYGVPVKGTQTTTQNRYAAEFSDKIRVCVRKRPLSAKEIKKSGSDIVEVRTRRSLTLHEPKLKLDMSKYTEHHGFIFDEVFDANADNFNVYQRTALPLVNYVFEGGKATCFAYGQTGSGKTYTMLNETCGLYFLAAQDMFRTLLEPAYQHLQLYVSFFEIYQGQLYDLLDSRKRLYAREDGKQQIVISGLREVSLNHVENLLEVFKYGSAARSTGTTGANTDSSRSHAIMQLFLKYKSNPAKVHGKFSFIDLAGSERGADRGETNKQTRMEGSEINKSLLALKECIRALDQDKKHLPFRQSKLTQVLKDSFMGNSRTCMIGTFSPDISNSEHTLNTLRYADRVKELRRETMNDEPVDEEVDTIEDQILLDDDDEDEDDDDQGTEDWSQSQNQRDDRFDLDEDVMDVDPEFDLTKPYVPAVSNPPPPKRTPTKPIHARTRSAAAPTDRFGVTNRPSNNHLTSRSVPPPPVNTSVKPVQQSVQQPVQQPAPPRIPDPPAPVKAVRQSPPQTTPTPAPFSLQTVQSIAQMHRAQIKEVTDCCKDEARLLSDLTVIMSGSSQIRGGDADYEGIFKDYLTNVETVLERKLEAIAALRDKINGLGYSK